MRTQAGWIEGAIAAAGELGEWALEAGASRIGESCVDEVLSRLRGQQPPAPGVGKAGGTGSTGPPSAAPLTAAARARQAVADARLAEASAELAAVNAGQTAAHMQQAIAYAEEQARLRAEYDRLRAEDASLRLLRLRYLGYRGQGEGTPETISPGICAAPMPAEAKLALARAEMAEQRAQQEAEMVAAYDALVVQCAQQEAEMTADFAALAARVARQMGELEAMYARQAGQPTAQCSREVDELAAQCDRQAGELLAAVTVMEAQHNKHARELAAARTALVKKRDFGEMESVAVPSAERSAGIGGALAQATCNIAGSEGDGRPHEAASPSAQTALVWQGALPFLTCSPRHCPRSAWWS